MGVGGEGGGGRGESALANNDFQAKACTKLQNRSNHPENVERDIYFSLNNYTNSQNQMLVFYISTRLKGLLVYLLVNSILNIIVYLQMLHSQLEDQ